MTDPTPSRPSRNRLIVAVLVALVGVAWVVQGTGAAIPGALMNGNPFWAYVGIALIAGAFLYAAWPRLRPR